MELLRRIRVEDGDVFFLMITGFPGIDSAVNAMKEGAYDYIVKPFHMDDMRLKVERALHVKKTEASLKRVKGLFLSCIDLDPGFGQFGNHLRYFLEGSIGRFPGTYMPRFCLILPFPGCLCLTFLI